MAALSDQFGPLSDYYLVDEAALLQQLIGLCDLSPADRAAIQSSAAESVTQLRAEPDNINLIDSFLLEYDLSSQEGLTLMRLAESLIRTPDFMTGRILMRDKLNNADWAAHAKQSDNFWVNQATSGLRFTKKWIKTTDGTEAQNLLARLGDRAMAIGVGQAMKVMGEHFVLGRDIKEAVENSKSSTERGYSYSYDMLGEAAYTQEDAERYFQAYLTSINYLAKDAVSGQSFHQAPGISIKLSALHPRYEYAKRETCVPDLVAKTLELAVIAKAANLSLTIDAEECDRLEVSLLIFEALLGAPELAGWDGLGLVVQAYQRRATKLIPALIDAVRDAGLKITIRLVKGAYWDMEIKRAQELGLTSYPVFTRKENTDISYAACARLLLDAPDVIYPQFATHNAHTAATILHMSQGLNSTYEFQRLHGMGGGLHEDIMQKSGKPCRVYAPVGSHKDLLPYLVRRLLENGANSSFVNQQFDESIPAIDVVEDPLALAEKNTMAANPKIPTPIDLFDGRRQSAAGLDITQSNIETQLETLSQSFEPYKAFKPLKAITAKTKRKAAPLTIVNPAKLSQTVGQYLPSTPQDIDRAVKSAKSSKWSQKFTASQRADCLERAADILEADMPSYLSLLIFEAGKSYLDAISEVREAVDFLRYYAQQAKSARISERQALGTIACISPWNFPLAIFLGQIAASLAVGNTVIAKPAEQTPLIAHKAVDCLYRAGVPKNTLHLILGDGAALGSYLTRHSGIDGVCFTGSTRTAKLIAASLAETQRADLPLIAETGGLNAMIVDSSALLEQAISDVMASAFQSAGQRCSACRVVCVQEDIADGFVKMLAGAMQELSVSDPSDLETDVGPVIDDLAKQNIAAYIEAKRSEFKVIGESKPAQSNEAGHFITPIAFEIEKIFDLEKEVFGPVLHVLRFKGSQFAETLRDINALGFGLTMGLHSRLDSRVDWVSENARVGNLYVNRNQIGAVVGVQPFGGEGLSGTGPKAGGPHYLLRLSKKAQRSNTENAAPDAPPLSLKVTEPSDAAKQMIKNAKSASKIWAEKMPPETRRATIKSIFSPLINDETFWAQFELSETQDLPGPTGEINKLSLHPRGLILCLGEHEDNLRQLALALSMGNAVIASSETDALKTLSEAVFEQTKLKDLIQFVSLDSFKDVINGEIDGVAVDGAYRAPTAEYLCRREGAILPILSAQSDPQRFCHERTLTKDTTAAGGNATLLTLS